MEQLINYFRTTFDWFYIPRITITDLVEIVIIAVLLYYIMTWFKTTRAWTLVKGILVLILFCGLAALFQFNTILWIMKNTIRKQLLSLSHCFRNKSVRRTNSLPATGGRAFFFEKQGELIWTKK